MEITRTAKPVRNMANVTVWHCSSCDAVHMSVGKMVLNFTREEFADFTEAVVDVNYSGWARVSGDHSLLDLAMIGPDGEHGATPGMVH